MEGKACILKDFFSDITPVGLRKAKIIYHLGLAECNRAKKTFVLSIDIMIISFAIFSDFLRYMHS